MDSLTLSSCLILLCFFTLVPSGEGQVRLANSAASYTNNLIPSLNRRGVGSGGSIGAGGAGIGLGIGIGGVDNIGNPIGVGGGFGGAGGFVGGQQYNKCGPLAPSCLPTPVDTLVECKYVYDPSVGTCVKIDVIPSCAVLSGAGNNVFNTLQDCQSNCV
uniref:BPTI/Kunitz inhibitor domain-containing protein n=1 Tax=Biomphalaria glabrata TaxID=6526 RepID=A0A2C9KVL3_BIOGL